MHVTLFHYKLFTDSPKLCLQFLIAHVHSKSPLSESYLHSQNLPHEICVFLQYSSPTSRPARELEKVHAFEHIIGVTCCICTLEL